jgi:hypothetical protein
LTPRVLSVATNPKSIFDAALAKMVQHKQSADTALMYYKLRVFEERIAISERVRSIMRENSQELEKVTNKSLC